MMSKIRFFIITLLFLPLMAAAQEMDTRANGYSVRYEKEHLFLQKDSGFNVVDYDIQWPEIVNFDSVTSLKRFISDMLLGNATSSIDSLLMSIGGIYGKPVTGPFKEIPDDNRFCYITLSAKVVSYEPGRWIAYMLESKVEPQKLSAFKPKSENRAIVYDLTRNQVMLADDMLRSVVKDMAASQDFYNQLFASLSDEMYDNLLSSEIKGVWIDNGQVYFLMDAISADGEKSTYTVFMPYEDCRNVLTRNVRNMVEKDLKRSQPKFISLPQSWKGDPVYNKVEQMPEMKGGQEGLRNYLAHVGNPNFRLSKPMRVYLSFVVDKTGKVQDVSVVSPASPMLDEHAVSVIKGLPTFTPGRHNGQPVCVRLYFPVNYKP